MYRLLYFFFFNDTATTEIYTLSLHDALPIWRIADELEKLIRQNLDLDGKVKNLIEQLRAYRERDKALNDALVSAQQLRSERSEEHTSELQSTPISRMPSSA